MNVKLSGSGWICYDVLDVLRGMAVFINLYVPLSIEVTLMSIPIDL